MKSALIIGAGIGGIATANILAKAGYKVTIVEQLAHAGGRAGQHKAEGFVFDSGPSWYLMPEVFEQYFSLLGEDVHKHLELIRLNPAYKVFFQNHDQAVTIHADYSKDSKVFEGIEPGSSKALRAYLDNAEDTYKTALKHFLYTNFSSVKSIINREVLAASPKMLRRALLPIDKYVSRYFTDSRLKQIMEYPMVFLGTSPYQAPSIYSLMSHMDFKQGVYYPKGGMYTVIQALVAIGKKSGVQYQFNAPVKSIDVASGVATGITLQDGTKMSADIVISNADMNFTETKLLAKKYRSLVANYWDKKQPSPSAILMYLGVKGSLPQLQHHNLLFTEDWYQNFKSIFADKTMPEPASMYVCKPSQTDKTVAPKGHENVFVLVPIPATLEISQQDTNGYAEKYLKQLSMMTGIEDLLDRIVYKKVIGPHDFHEQFNAWNGTALGLSHVLNQSALFRPKNVSNNVSNLYYVGASTMPGIGLPMCLISAQLVYKRLTADTSSGPLHHIEKVHHA